MVAKSGRSLLIARGDGASPEVFTSLSGAREDGITLNGELIDITDKLDGGWRTYLEGDTASPFESPYGLQSVSISSSGVSVDDTLINDWINGIPREYQITVGDEGVFEGRFMIASLEKSGAHNNEVTYSLTLESSGEVTFAAS